MPFAGAGPYQSVCIETRCSVKPYYIYYLQAKLQYITVLTSDVRVEFINTCGMCLNGFIQSFFQGKQVQMRKASYRPHGTIFSLSPW